MARKRVAPFVALCLAAATATSADLALAEASAGSYALVADAGSTGTRVYLFHLPAGGKVDIQDMGKGPALSSFQAAPENAHQAVAPQLEKAKGLIPEGVRGAVPVSVFATAGMRLVSPSAQDAIYQGLTKGLLAAAGGFAFDAARLQARTISGREEGIFALVAANYLAKNLHTSLKAATGSFMGVLDLGGSSTQIAVPPTLASGESLSAKLGEEHTFVRSFLNLGMEHMRQRTFQRFVDRASVTARSRRAAPNPCSYYGYSEAEEAWRGTGEASACEAAVVAVLEDERRTCASDAAKTAASECLSASPVAVPAGGKGEPRFFLISGYMYVTDFAGWLLKQPGVLPEGFQGQERPFERPTIQELREAAAVLCAEPWASLNALASDPARKHKFTGAKKVPHRCFELNYIVALLSVGYGLPAEERLFHIVDDIDGGEIEWTLGAFLHGLNSAVARQEL